ncbi:UNVERIFIED_CONTAM: DEAD-box ATP-dependent RNA helicase 7 [Sesamum calycinum]|uniref:RNA helicase n=1 Tax=Sesamum calycinum TaxID=2727403 RepID=A0AAW2RQV7_9LAMI
MKNASTNVRHIVLPCSVSARTQLIPDIIRCYSSGGRTIIFTETKDSASTLAGVLPGARALHGDIQQATREVTLSGFRSGKFSTLVATNVAARGLDIDDVQLIIQCEPPRDVEAYIHRSGRTGRAGKTGVAVMLYDPRKSNFSKIERESGVKFEHISAPQPADIAKAAGAEAAEKINEISDSFAYGVLRRFLPEDKVESIKGLALTADGKGAVFDVAAQDLDTFLAGQENAAGVSLEVVKSLPRLQEREQSRGRFGGGGGGRGGFSDRRFSGGRGGGRGGFFKGPGGGRGRGNNNRKWNSALHNGWRSPFLDGAKRFYYVDRNEVYHFKPRGNLEKELGETQFNQLRKQFKGKILPPLHPESIRVQRISQDIIEALHKGLRKEQVWSDIRYSPESVGLPIEAPEHETIKALSDRSLDEEQWHGEDKWQRRMKS